MECEPMSITLSVKANDPEVERLLAYLDANLGSSTENKIWLLERTQKWLHATLSIAYDVPKASITLGFLGGPEPVVEQIDSEPVPQRD